MLDATDQQRGEGQEQDQFSPSQIPAHGKYPFIEEFSEFLSSVSTQALKNTLMTNQQRLFARSLWEAENYGGSKAKCEARLKEIYGAQWKTITSVEEHMIPEREYCEYVLILEHQRQWDEARKTATISAKQKLIDD